MKIAPLQIQLQHSGGGITAIRVHNPDRSHLFALFEGRRADELAARTKQIYSVCAEAQQLSVELALGNNSHTAALPQTRDMQYRRVALESLREHLLHIARCWPSLIGESSALKQLAPLYREIEAQRSSEQPKLPTTLNKAIGQWLLHMPLVQLSELQQLPDLHRWCEKRDTIAARTLNWTLQQNLSSLGFCDIPRLQAHMLPDIALQIQNDPAGSLPLCAKPQWQGLHLDNSAAATRAHPLLEQLQQHFGRGLLYRQFERLVNIAHLVESFRETGDESQTLPKMPQGTASVRTARGWLMHSLQFKDDKVSQFRAIAPTEWNFCSGGLAEQCLHKLQPTADVPLNIQAKSVIESIDPCVEYTLEQH